MNKKENKWKILSGNIILDLQQICQTKTFHGILGFSLSAFIIAQIFKGKNTRIAKISDINENFIFANQKMKISLKKYDPENEKFTGNIYPNGIFGWLFKPRKQENFEIKLAQIWKFSNPGTTYLKGLINKRFLGFRIHSVSENNIVYGYFYNNLTRTNINELMLRRGQCEIFEEKLEELSEENLRQLDEMRNNEIYAKLTGKGKWHEYYKNSAKISKVDSWFKFRLQKFIMKNKRRMKNILA